MAIEPSELQVKKAITIINGYFRLVFNEL